MKMGNPQIAAITATCSFPGEPSTSYSIPISGASLRFYQIEILKDYLSARQI